MVQSVAGARAEGHPVCGDIRVTPPPSCAMVCGHGDAGEGTGQEDGWTLCKYRAVALAKRPSGPLTEWSVSGRN
jgi:hypothetical protein